MVNFCSCFRGHKRSNSDEKNTTVTPPNSGQETTNIAGPSSSSAANINYKEGVHEFSYRDLARWTDNFGSDSYIGEGGFGQVYRGKIESTGQDIAVKTLKRFSRQKKKEFDIETSMLRQLRHPNLVKMIGYCNEGYDCLIVYDYMPKVSLDKHLYGTEEVLDWNTRLKIAIGAASGLEYLHNFDGPVIHGDIKSSNILLTEDYQAKLSDFGLSQFGPTHVMTSVMGTMGYCCPEYYKTRNLSLKSDVYSFGVVLLELITGRPAIQITDQGQVLLTNLVRPMMLDIEKHDELVDPKLNGVLKGRNLYEAIQLVLSCLEEQTSDRPDISMVISSLNLLVRFYHEGGPSRKGKEIATDLMKGSSEEGIPSYISKGDEVGPSRTGKEIMTDLEEGSNEGTLTGEMTGLTLSEEGKKDEE